MQIQKRGNEIKEKQQQDGRSQKREMKSKAVARASLKKSNFKHPSKQRKAECKIQEIGKKQGNLNSSKKEI